ncbi:nucleoside hydrolase-like domain-containing protein [Flagellimonas amoyensis]|uniref:nucleoside hydrolase-like domain-containing protein n=1 Tax=Flagellimonas amoyensis TaxID=2169401 RepID=UPI001F2EBFF7|nr:nucleoside hydrolase-like domain-containing protein [Allomuricauda amoyensis]
MQRFMLTGLALILGISLFGQQMQKDTKRTIVTTDGEIDDVDTFIRFLLYTNEFDTEGLIYSSSMWHWKGDGKGTTIISEMEMTKNIYGERSELRWPGTSWIQELLSEYEKVHPNLLLHDKNYPSAAALLELVKVGNIDFEGEMDKRTEGSEWIAQKLLDNDPREIFLQAWGGTNTIARALKSIEEDYSKRKDWKLIKDKVSKKAIIYTIMDQDATFRKYIGPNWPEIRVFYNANQFWCFAYPWKMIVPKSQQPYMEGSFMGPNIINGHGPLLQKYYSYGDGQKQEGDPNHFEGDGSKIVNTERGSFSKYDFISEGDSPAFLHLVNVGLANYEDPSRGGWSGRFRQSNENPFRFEDGDSVTDLNPETGEMDKSYPQTRWIKPMQLDFAARADWCVTSFDVANHPPKVNVAQGNAISAEVGETISLNLTSEDVDGDAVYFNVWSYAEAGDGPASIELKKDIALVQIPKSAQSGNEYHIIVEATDTGFPALTRYQRVIITVP